MTPGQSKRLDSMTHRSAIKLLHVRASGADQKIAKADIAIRGPPFCGLPQGPSTPTRQRMSLDHYRAQQVPGLCNFAPWAFSPHGLPNLRVLAYGDFSYDGRYVEDTFVFGRDGYVQSSNKPTFLAADPKTDYGFSLLGKEERNEVMARYGDFLEACPVDPLLQMDAPDIEAETWSGPGAY